MRLLPTPYGLSAYVGRFSIQLGIPGRSASSVFLSFSPVGDMNRALPQRHDSTLGSRPVVSIGHLRLAPNPFERLRKPARLYWNTPCPARTRVYLGNWSRWWITYRRQRPGPIASAPKNA